MSVAIIHYSAPPVVGGVESVIAAHAELFVRAGYGVRVIAGEGNSAFGETVLIPELASPAAEASALRAALDRATAGFSVVFIHNILTMPFHLVATAALWEIAASRPGTRWVNWVHDIAATNPDYPFPAAGAPEASSWERLRHAAPGVSHAAVSAHRQNEYCALTGLSGAAVPVVPNGISALPALGLTGPVAQLARERELLRGAPLLFQPARLLGRKNIGATLDVTAALRAAGHPARAVITAAPDPHRPGSEALREELARRADALGITRYVTFVGDYFAPSPEDVAALYRLADALFFPSHQEGFGLPLLEAGLHRLPAFCTGSEPMRSVLGSHVTPIDPSAPPEQTAATVINALASDPAYLARRQVLGSSSWDAIFEQHIAPRFLKGA